MDDYRAMLSFEPINDYDKARKDVLQAMNSVRKLPPQQQQILAEELFEASNAVALLNILRQIF